jgi:tRNA A-37 threonylcarbamoyl transferase component Bud32
MTSPSSPPDPLHGLNPERLLDLATENPGHADTAPQTRPDLPSMEEVAAAFPDLEVQELIGRGGMSAVFRARQPRLHRVVALKVLPKSLAALPGFAERFTREGQVLARLTHPHIVTVHDFGERGGFWFLIMEHVDGVNLRQAMRAGRFTPEHALEVIPAICDALQFAHGQGVLHRDIKPENILLDAKGGIKIADFGIAKILGEDVEGAMLLTQSGAKLGTAPYMAPEQIEKPASVDHRADIYSLGVVFYEMLTGELPLGRFAAPSELAGVGGGMDAVVLRALEKVRARRQQSAEEFKTQVAGAGSAPQRHHKVRSDEPFEYRSKRKLGGLPLLHVTHGRDPITGEVREARGIIAVGDKARGVLAFGGVALGVVACGGMARGLVAIGGVAFGLISIGGVALGLLFAFGGFSMGGLALGGVAAGWHACGGMVFGWNGFGAWVFAHTGHGGEVFAPVRMQSLQSMPSLTVWLVSLLRYTWLALILWLPLFAGMGLVQWWARNEVARLKVGQSKETSGASLICLLAALAVFCGVLGAAVVALLPAMGTASPSVIMPMLVTLTGLLGFATAVPLWLRLVPTNGLYGLRLASTMISEERWSDANAVLGRHQFGWSLMLMAAGLAGFHQLPRHQESYTWAAFALVLTSVVATAFSIGWWLRHHPVNGPVKKTSRWARYAGQFFTAIIVAFFIKGFIFDAYRMRGRNEDGVPQGSHWIASKLDTGFAPGDIIAFEHESGHPYIARVVKREDKALLLKRGGVEEAFGVPWDKVIGKLLFSHFTPLASPSP